MVAPRGVLRSVSLVCALSGVLIDFPLAIVLDADQSIGSRGNALLTQADRRIRELQAESDRLVSQSRTLLTELRALEVDRQIKTEELKKAEVTLAALAATQQAAAARLAGLEAQRVAQSPGVKERLVEMYKRGRGGYLSLLLRTDDPSAFGRLARGVASVAALDQLRFDAHRRTIRAEQEAVAELRTRQEQVTAATAETSRARTALDQAVAAANRRIDQLDRERDMAARYVGELQDAQVALHAHVGGLGTAPGLPLAPFRGTLPWPVSGRVVAPFAGSDRVGTTLVRSGVEIAASEAVAVHAVHGGTVAYAAPFTGFGTLVIVDHGAQAFSVYGHLLDATIGQGALVERGTIVGRAGRSPAGQPVLYFELRIDGRSVDPVQWLAR